MSTFPTDSHSNSLFCLTTNSPKPKDIQFTIIYGNKKKKKMQIFTERLIWEAGSGESLAMFAWMMTETFNMLLTNWSIDQLFQPSFIGLYVAHAIALAVPSVFTLWYEVHHADVRFQNQQHLSQIVYASTYLVTRCNQAPNCIFQD